MNLPDEPTKGLRARSSARLVRYLDFFDGLGVNDAALFVFVFGVIERIMVWLFYGPVSYSDSATYWRLANLILESWSSYDGTRVPVYPYFLGLVGSDRWVYILQLSMGILITMGYFYIAWRITGKAWFAGLAGMLHQLNIGQLFFEANILTETLATFWLLLALVCLVHGTIASRSRQWILAFGTGLASALALLTRPIFVILPPLLGLWMVLTWGVQPWPDWKPDQGKENLRKHLGHISWVVRKQFGLIVAFLVPSVGLVFGWVSYIHNHYGDWALSTMTGYHLVQHTGAFFEYVPDKYAALRDVYIEYRDARVAEYGTPANTIWEAIPPMMQASGQSFYDLSRILARISVDLIREHPLLYLKSVGSGWWLFWRVPVYWSPDGLKVPENTLGPFTSVIAVLILIQRILLFGMNLLFILTPVGLIYLRKYYQKGSIHIERGTWSTWALLLGLVWSASILQAFLDHGDNPRFLIPLQTIPVIWALWLFSLGKACVAGRLWWSSFRVKFMRT